MIASGPCCQSPAPSNQGRRAYYFVAELCTRVGSLITSSANGRSDTRASLGGALSTLVGLKALIERSLAVKKHRKQMEPQTEMSSASHPSITFFSWATTRLEVLSSPSKRSKPQDRPLQDFSMAPLDLFGDETVDKAISKKVKGKGKAKELGADDFTINPAFAAKYEEKKRGEELSKRASNYRDVTEQALKSHCSQRPVWLRLRRLRRLGRLLVRGLGCRVRHAGRGRRHPQDAEQDQARRSEHLWQLQGL